MLDTLKNHNTSLSNGKSQLINLLMADDISHSGQQQTLKLTISASAYRMEDTIVSLLYVCETWTLFTESERRIQALEMKCFRRLLRISYRKQKKNDYVPSLGSCLAGPQESLLVTVKKQDWLGLVVRHDILRTTILRGYIEDGRRCCKKECKLRD